MKSFSVESYEIKTSRNNLKVPVVNDVHLHSMYNPAKEAQAVISKHNDAIENSSNVLVLGLGFAYHVYELCRKLENFHGNNYKVIVIEPNEQVYKDCVANHLFPNKNIEVHSGEELDKLFSNINLVKFLINKPTIISHPASLELYKSFFTSFLEYSSPTDVKAIAKHISSRDLKSYLYTDTSSTDLTSFVKNNVLTKNKFNNKYDHLMLAYTHLINGDF